MSKWRRSSVFCLQGSKSTSLTFRRLSIERNMFLDMYSYSDAGKKLIEVLSCEIQLQMLRISNDEHCKMAALEVLLFANLIVILLHTSPSIQRMKGVNRKCLSNIMLVKSLPKCSPARYNSEYTTEVERPVCQYDGDMRIFVLPSRIAF